MNSVHRSPSIQAIIYFVSNVEGHGMRHCGYTSGHPDRMSMVFSTDGMITTF